MRELDKSKFYYLSSLNNEEVKTLFEWYKINKHRNQNIDIVWLKARIQEGKLLSFYKDDEGDELWGFYKHSNTSIDAKELFYTLENIQVDCSELTQEEVNNIIDIYELNDIKFAKRDFKGTNTSYSLIMSFNNIPNEYTTITYEKFMELFGKEEVKGLTNDLAFIDYIENTNLEIAEESFKEITNSIADLLIYKNQKYGNSALNPLYIFNGKSKVGQRIDDKLARVKNSKELRKNDIADLLGYLTLVCQENNWTNFDEFKD